MGNETNDCGFRSLDSHTVMYGVFGDPVGHSKSPAMMNRAFRELGINAAYAAFHVRPERLADAVRGIRALQFRGVNVTVPHKIAVMAHLDEIDEGARVIGAVNTIVNDGGKLIGYNTDGIGYVRSLREETGIELRGKRILVLGAGGAARGVVYALARQAPERIWIANRTAEKAAELAEALSAYADISGSGYDKIDELRGRVDLIVNTTSVGNSGMDGSGDAVPIDTSWLDERVTASDIIYNPRITAFLRRAEERGARIHPGLGMLIYQGAYAFEYWTGQDAPAAVMRAAVEEALARST